MMHILKLNSFETVVYLFDHLVMIFQGPVDDHLRRIHGPTPFGPDRIRMVTPAEDALVSARQAWGGLHALVGRDSVK